MEEKPLGKNPVPAQSDPVRRLEAIMAVLRSETGCPWDREQDHRSLRPYLMEESHEVLEAIDEGDMAGLREELGDLLLQIVFHSQLARERAEFTLDDVADAICDKLVRRHPHVFGNVQADSPGEVVTNWEEIKKREKAKRPQKPGVSSLFQGVPGTLPALLLSKRLQEKAATVGFDWPSDDGVLEKLHEEIQELREAHESGDREHVEEEFGDVFFLLANLARRWGIDPESAARGTCQKFLRRFTLMEERAGGSIKGMTLENLDALWDQAKERESSR